MSAPSTLAPPPPATVVSRSPPAARVLPPAGAGVSAWLQHPLRLTLLLTLFGALLLQVWRPLFHLTDDNLSGWLPAATDLCRRLWSGRSPFVSDFLFGGHYSLMRDPACFGLWSPWLLVFSPLALTRFYYLLPDAVSTVNLLVIAGAFCWFALRMRRTLDLPVSNAAIVFASLSYAFTPYNFIVGSSWIGFLNSQAAFPLIVASLYAKSAPRAVALIAAALLYSLFGGHAHTFVMLGFFVSLLVVLLALTQRSWRPVNLWLGGVALALVLASPFLLPALGGFSQTDRHAGVSVEAATISNVPAFPLAASFLLGPLSHLFMRGLFIHWADPLFNLAIAFALVNVPLVYALVAGRREKFGALEFCLLGCVLVAALFIVRPAWVGQTLAHLPLLKSLRWPFREIALLHFFTHFLFLLRARPLAGIAGRLAGAGTGLAYAMVFLCAAPTFYLFNLDRQLIISGDAERFWRQALPANGAAPRQFVVVASPVSVFEARDSVPFSLLGAYSYAALFGFVNLSGYSPTLPEPLGQTGIRPYHFGGIFMPATADRIIKNRPGVGKITLAGINPIMIHLTEVEGERVFRCELRPGESEDELLTRITEETPRP